MVVYYVINLNGEVDVFQLPSGKYLVDPSYLSEFKKLHNID